MDRREFVKTCAALGVTVAIPSVVVAKGVEAGLGRPSALVADNLGFTIEFTDYHIDQRGLERALTVSDLRVKDGQGFVDVSCDTVMMWSSMMLEDSEGRMWTTADGERWECDDMWFEAAEGLGV